MPANLPLPPGARLTAVHALASGFTVVAFVSPGSAHSNLLFAIAALQAADYTIGRGIVGTTDSRLPFTKDGRPGVIQLTATDPCVTSWQIEA
jgi:hypothetical protein